MNQFKVGDMVVVPEGRVGMINFVARYTSPPCVRVQFGADGPYHMCSRATLRWATVEEIEDAGLRGVGRNRTPLERMARIPRRGQPRGKLPT